MKHTIYISLLFLLIGGSACQKEDDLTPSGEKNNWFAPAIDATDAESVLRRKFYDDTDCYLLFNDTLRHEYQGTDENGNPYYLTELLAMEWTITGTTSRRYVYDYLTDWSQKQQVTQFLKDVLLPYIKNVLPFSVFPVNGSDQYINPNGEWVYKGTSLMCINSRCMVIDVSGLWNLSQEGQISFAQKLCCLKILGDWGADVSDPTFYYSLYNHPCYDFFTSSLGYAVYDYDKSWLFGITLGEGEDGLCELGFIINPYEDYTPSALEDAISYITMCLSMTEEEVREKYGTYPTVMEKYNIIKPLVSETGIKF